MMLDILPALSIIDLTPPSGAGPESIPAPSLNLKGFIMSAKKQNILALLDKADRLAAKNTALNSWHRLMSRNSYTIDPKRPASLPSDAAAARAATKATRLWRELGNWNEGHAPILTRDAVRRFKD